MLPSDYRIRLMQPADYATIGALCRAVYPHDGPYTAAELATHHAVFPQGQFVAEHVPSGTAVGRPLHAAAPHGRLPRRRFLGGAHRPGQLRRP